MNFGAPSTLEELNQLDLSLPLDHSSNSSFQFPKNDSNVYVGLSVYAEDNWVGDLYPEGTKKKDYLQEYIRRFNCIELNSTFYNAKKVVFNNLKEAAAGSNIKFCPKFNRRISHIKRLKDEVFELTDYFVEKCLDFGDNLGMPFLQMPENFGPKWFERLKEYLQHLPKDFPLAVELRHEEWYQGTVFNELFDLLREHNKTAVITDTAMNRNIIHQRFSTDKVFVRFAAYDEHPTNLPRIEAWAERIKSWLEMGISEVYFMSKQEDETFAPRQARYFIEKLNAITDLNLKSPYAV